MIKGIIFDMDGVITDTEFFDFAVERDFVKMHNPNFDIHKKEVSLLYGQSHFNLYSLMKEYIGDKLSVEEVEVEFTKYNDERYASLDYRTVFREDIKKVLKWAKDNGIQCAVASSSKYKHILNVLETCGILEEFDVIYSGEFVVESKPNPEIYMNTLELLGLDPSECITIEDSFFGIKAANLAGLVSVAYKENRVYVDQSEADYIVNDMNEYLELLKKIEKES